MTPQWVINTGDPQTFPLLVKCLTKREAAQSKRSIKSVVDPIAASDDHTVVVLSGCAIMTHNERVPEAMSVACAHASLLLKAHALGDYQKSDFHRDFMKGLGLNPSMRPVPYEPIEFQFDEVAA